MFQIQMLPAQRGDALLVRYGSENEPTQVLIDGGLAGTEPVLRERLSTNPELELLVVTHIDLDHIAGILKLLRSGTSGLTVDDCWFNGYKHLCETPDVVLGVDQGEEFSKAITRLGLPWNRLFETRAAAIEAGLKPRQITLPGGMRLTLLSPFRKRLDSMKRVWKSELEDSGLVLGANDHDLESAIGNHCDEAADEGVLGSGDPDVVRLASTAEGKDASVANGSSIAFLAEFDGKACLFAGDAYPSDIVDALRLLGYSEQNRLQLDAMKLSHHGGKHNTSTALLGLLDCSRFLFSTSGAVFRHPHDEVPARILLSPSRSTEQTFFFNYQSEQTQQWDSARLQRRFDYKAVYPDTEIEGLTLNL